MTIEINGIKFSASEMIATLFQSRNDGAFGVVRPRHPAGPGVTVVLPTGDGFDVWIEGNFFCVKNRRTMLVGMDTNCEDAARMVA